MRKVFLSATTLGMAMLYAFTGPHSDVYHVDTKLSSLEWTGEKIGGKHNGVIMLSKGEISSNHGRLSGVFEVDMTTIQTKDLTGEYATKLDGHLKADDFFGAEKFPKAKFVSTSIAPIKESKEGGYTHTVKGNLTIKEKTNEITFDAIIKTEANKVACVGTAKIDRAKYDIKYGSKSFFPEIGDKMINDEFAVKFNVVAVK